MAHGYHILDFTYCRYAESTQLTFSDVQVENFVVYIICLQEKTAEKAHKFMTTILNSTSNGRTRTY